MWALRGLFDGCYFNSLPLPPIVEWRGKNIGLVNMLHQRHGFPLTLSTYFGVTRIWTPFRDLVEVLVAVDIGCMSFFFFDCVIASLPFHFG